MPKSVYNPTSNDIFPGTGPRPNSDTVGEFGVRSMFPPDPSGIWLDRGLSGPHSPLLPPVVGTAANSPTVSTVVSPAAKLECPRNGGFCGRKMGDYVVDKRVLAQGTQDVGLQLIPSPAGTVSRGRAVRRILAVRSYSPALPDV